MLSIEKGLLTAKELFSLQFLPHHLKDPTFDFVDPRLGLEDPQTNSSELYRL
jgi:hypothetical protein